MHLTIRALLLLLKVGDHCINDGQKQVVTVTNSTAATSTTNSTVGTVNDLAVLSPTG